MVAQNGGLDVRLSKGNMPVLSVPAELFAVYQPLIGYQATLLWLNLRFKAMQGESFSPISMIEAGFTDVEVEQAFQRLRECRLIGEAEDGTVAVYDPLPAELFNEMMHGLVREAGGVQPQPQTEASATSSAQSQVESQHQADDARQVRAQSRGHVEAQAQGHDVVSSAEAQRQTPARSPLTKRRKSNRMLQLVDVDEGPTSSENPDMQAVVQIYHKRIGMIGPTQYEKLRFWVEEQGMEGAVVAVAIEETVQSAEVPRISYLEGILRNWYNDGIRTFAELQERKKASKVLSSGSDRSDKDSHEGYANATAYQSVSTEMVARWKELYPDEYDS